MITDRNGSLDWVVLGCARFPTASEVWGTPATDGAVLRWAGDQAAELIVEAFCSRCDGGTDGFLVGTGFDDDLAAMRLCSGCALAVPPAEMLRWVSLDDATVELGLPVRVGEAEPEVLLVRRERLVRSVLNDLEATMVGGQLAARVVDPVWREQVASAAAANPRVVVAIADAVAALGDADVLDLYPGLAELGQMLPRAATLWLESTGHKAAARLGLPALNAGT